MQHLQKNVLLGLLLALLCPMGLAAQGTGDVRGFVFDDKTGEPVIFTNVYLEGTTHGSTTDVNGLYSINKVPVGEYILTCSYIGYDTTRMAITIADGQILNRTIRLKENEVLLDAVVVEGAKQEAKTEVRTSTIKITPKQISKIPAIGGEPDLAQYLQVLPGVVFTGDQGGQLYIRGGSQIQTKVLLDGITIYNPFHSVGLFSVFETDLLRNVEVMTGGYGAEYGGRISAVIDVDTRDGNKSRLAGKIGANTFLAKAVLEGPIVKLKDSDNFSSSFVASFKTSYLDRTSKLLYSYIDEQGLPYNFTDAYAKMSFSGKGSKISLSGFRFGDNATFQGTSEFGWKSWGMGTNFVMVPGQSKVVLDGFLSYSQYDLNLSEGEQKPRTSGIGGFNGGVNFTYYLPMGDVKYGIEVSGYSTDFKFFNALGTTIEDKQFTTELGGFFNVKINLNDKLLLQPGARVNYYASLSSFALEPRLGLKYNATDKLRFKASGGLYTQNFISAKSDRDVVNLFTGFLSAPEGALKDQSGQAVNNNLQKALHAIGGVELDLTKNLEANLEGYYKRFTQLINVNRNKLFPSDPNYVIETGDAYGFDALLKFSNKRWFLWGVYSLGWVKRDDGTQVYFPHFDRRHNLNFLGNLTLGKRSDWELSARWNFGSGFPFTRTQGFYELLDLGGGIDSDFLTQNGTLETIYEDKLNDGRLPVYHRFDISAKKRFPIGANSVLEASASITNIYNRDNIFYYDRIRNERVDQLPILPSFGLSFSF